MVSAFFLAYNMVEVIKPEEFTDYELDEFHPASDKKFQTPSVWACMNQKQIEGQRIPLETMAKAM